MGETFYTALGVDDEADGDAIRRAYRNLVKECHPDVSDDPTAPERFKRLTTARNVLLDDDERARYDRLGHDAYVREQVDSGVWADAVTTRQVGDGGHAAGAGASNAGQATRDRSVWLGESGSRRDNHASQSGGHGQSTGGAGESRDPHAWQRASPVYRRVGVRPRSRRSAWDRLGGGLRSVGAWLPLHAVLICSAVATAWFTYIQTSRVLAGFLPALAVSGLLVVVVAVVSVVHLVSEVYT